MMKISRLPAFLILFLLFCFPAYGQTDFYWEEPEVFSPDTGTFPVSAFNRDVAVVFWQETSPGQIRVSMAVRPPGGSWKIRRNVAGPYSYSGAEPSIINAAVDDRNRIILAVAASSSQTEILISDDMGETFRPSRLDSGSESSVAPRIFIRAGGGYLLFITRGRDRALSLHYALSDDGFTWSSFRPFANDSAMQLDFLPTHAALGLVDYVVYQSFVGSSSVSPAFQLFLKSSSDGGRTWSPPRQITSFQDPYMNTQSAPERFDNQRPHISVQRGGLFLVWERRYGSGSPQIYGATLNQNGILTGTVERINTLDAYCNNPIAFQYEGEPLVIWFDNRQGQNRVFLARRDEVTWRNYDLSRNSGPSAFARPVSGAGLPLVFWQTTVRDVSRIYTAFPDTNTASPRLRGQNFTPGSRSRSDRVRIAWDIPADPSGIEGFAYAWSSDPRDEPEREIMLRTGLTSIERIALEDGSWYFSLIARDFAGNWSAPARIEYIRDTTAPPAANILPPAVDRGGYLLSNTFDIRWNPPPASDVAGYTWKLDYLGEQGLFRTLGAEGFQTAARARFSNSGAPAPRIMGTGTSASFTNEDDGIWRFTLYAVDQVGNIGPPSRIFFRTNKYVPHTFITHVDAAQNELGVLSLRIIGRGFQEGGDITRVFLDRDGQPPYDKEFFLDRLDYTVLSDREIGGIKADDIDKGLYRVGVEHPLRGIVMTDPRVSVDITGTIKFGDFSQSWRASWSRRDGRRFTALPVILGIIMLFCALALALSVRSIALIIAESAALRLEAAALITGDFMPLEKKKRLARIKRRGTGLRLKLASFTVALVLLVVVMVAAPLYLMMTSTQEETLLTGLYDRSTVLLEGLASSARAYLPSGNVLELGFLPDQTAAIPEARYVTITGFGSGSTVYSDHVWATNDPDILSKIDTVEFQPGVSRLEDVLSPRLEQIAVALDSQARSAAGDLSASIASLTQEGIALALNTDEASIQRRDDIQVTTRSLETRLNAELTRIAAEIGSEPVFSTTSYDRSESRVFIFFKPVMYRQGAEDIYFRGLIRLEVSIDSIIEKIVQGQLTLLRIISVVAFTVLAIGAVGALVLSTFIIRPITRLVGHVELIRDTEDKTKLEGVEIEIRSRDELEVLGNTINDMTHGLVKAAQAALDMSIGKEIQKKFIPLELDQEGNKRTSGRIDSKNLNVFGYYEGAKGVSGDYFDYKDLDGRYYAVIKCDVAGKGIPAALIMIQVATMFLNYFKSWKPNAKGMHVEEVVYQINDFIEALGFKGRFAAFTLCLLDSETGILRFCNAGDNIVHWFDASEGRMKVLTLPETPATGVLPNFLVESKGGYQVQTLKIDPGDILFLYTDGIEEAKRKFRDSAFKEIICTEGDEGAIHENHQAGQGDEELGADRVEAIINAVMNRQAYTLHKYHNGEGEDADLQFDFSGCEGTVEEAIMAMVSVEKMFRLYKKTGAAEDSLVLVDKKIDMFLKEHFLQYQNYCSFTRDYHENDTYMYYTHVNEDPQYDDLTIIGIKRK